VVFKLDMDPEHVMDMADDQDRPMASVIAKRADRMTRWAFVPQLEFPSPTKGFMSSSRFTSSEHGQDHDREMCRELSPDIAPRGFCSFCLESTADEEVVDEIDVDSTGKLESTLTGPEIQQAVHQAMQRNIKAGDQPLSSPDKAPQGWICRRGPNGRVYWHHLALGPAPWEEEIPARNAALPRGMGPVVSPNLPDDGWVSTSGLGGRLQWHHRSLGPAPWEVPKTWSLSRGSDTSLQVPQESHQRPAA
jgi:hypothetical protein